MLNNNHRDSGRLETIAERQRRSRTRDLAFAALVAIAGTASVAAAIAAW